MKANLIEIRKKTLCQKTLTKLLRATLPHSLYHLTSPIIHRALYRFTCLRSTI